MNIHAITPNIQNNNKSNIPTINNNQIIKPRYINTLNRDTVSFGNAAAKISDFLTDSVSKNINRMERIATIYLDVLESVASRLKEFGVSFDRAYCEKNAVKSPQSYTSKVVRSQSLNVPDRIRATLYINNPYDLSILNDKLLPEMQKRGYVLADTQMSIKDLMKRGYTPTAEELTNTAIKKSIPDIDIRLDDVTDQKFKLAPELQYSIGRPQKSGYEDIQIRFVREFDKKKSPIQHELIILFGPEYANAKHIESQKVYSLLRKFGELNMKFEDKTIGSNSLSASRYIELIQQMFRNKVSEKLFQNAKNKDLYNIREEVPIVFNEEDIKLLDNYFSVLRKRLGKCYTEIKPKKQQQKDLLEANHKQDSRLILEIQKGLNKTIDYFNNLNNPNPASKI